MRQKLKNNIFGILLLVSVLIINSSCQALMAIPLLILQLPIVILQIFFKMLPTLIKLAPLALLFIEGNGENAAEYYALLPADVSSFSMSNNVQCYVLDLSDKERALAIAQQVQARGDKMVLLKESSIIDSPEHVLAMYKNMKRNDIQFACDERITAGTNSSDMYNV